MKTIMVTWTLLLAGTTPVLAQVPAPGDRSSPVAGAGSGEAAARRSFLPNLRPQGLGQAPHPDDPSAEAKRDEQVYRSGDVLPAPLPLEEPGLPDFPLPSEPIEPYLLTKDHGPFMVNAYIFRGDYAAKMGQALAMELRQDYNLPAYVFFIKLQPGGSNIRGVPPTAPEHIRTQESSPPESLRLVDEAAVLIGHFPTIDDAVRAAKRIKDIHPTTLDGKKSPFPWRNPKSLKRALVTTNPLLPAQNLYPGRPNYPPGHRSPPPIPNGSTVDPEILRTQFVAPMDDMVRKMNEKTPHSIFKCPGDYTLVVSEFRGRQTLDENDPIFKNPFSFKQSPLQTAFDDAEGMAAQLAKHPTIQALGIQPYVFHDRTSSKVTLGSFQALDDPSAERVRQAAMRIVLESKDDASVSNKYLAPASTLFEVPRP